MTPEKAIALADGRAFTFTGRWPKGHVYDQSDQSKIILDPNYCAGAAVANVYQSMTGEVGDYAQMLYEGAKQRRPDHKDEKGGITLKEVCEYATEKLGGGNYYRLTTMGQIMSWIAVAGPVAAGFKWRSGMEYPRSKGRWWRRLFGARWAMRRGPVIGYHAVSILGASSREGGYVVMENSRGLSYGNKGTARMSWEDLSKALAAGELFAYGIDFNHSNTNT